jgi:uncharacterized protein (TIRG00374 family)
MKGLEPPPTAKSSQVRVGRRKVPRWLIVLATWVISIGSLVWALHGYDFSQLKLDLLSVKWGWVLLAVVLELAVYVLQAWRWLTLLSPVERMGLWETSQAIYIGLFASDVLPLRPGEIIRCYLLALWGEIPVSLTITSAAIERVLDGIWMVAAFWIAASVMTMPRALVDFERVLAVGVLVLSILFLYILFRKTHAHSLLSGWKWGQKFLHVLDQIHQMGNWRSLAAAFGITCIYWFVQILPIWALFRAYDMDLSFGSASVVLIIKAIGTIIPAAPGNLGVFQSVVKLALSLFSVESSVASGLSVLIWAALTIPPLIVGFVAVLLTGLTLGEIHHHAHHHVHTQREPSKVLSPKS